MLKGENNKTIMTTPELRECFLYTQSHSMNYFSSFTKLPRSKRHNLCIKIHLFSGISKIPIKKAIEKKFFSIAFLFYKYP